MKKLITCALILLGSQTYCSEQEAVVSDEERPVSFPLVWQVGEYIADSAAGDLIKIRKFLMCYPNSIDATYKENRKTALCAVIKGYFCGNKILNHYEVFDYLLSHGADRLQCFKGYSLQKLIRAYAEMRENTEQAKQADNWLKRLALKSDQIVHIPTMNQIEKYIEAAFYGDKDTFMIFVESFPEYLDVRDSADNSALFVVIYGYFKGRLHCDEFFKHLLRHGGDITSICDGETIQESIEKGLNDTLMSAERDGRDNATKNVIKEQVQELLDALKTAKEKRAKKDFNKIEDLDPEDECYKDVKEQQEKAVAMHEYADYMTRRARLAQAEAQRLSEMAHEIYKKSHDLKEGVLVMIAPTKPSNSEAIEKVQMP